MTYPPNDPNNPSGWPNNGQQGQSGSSGWDEPTTQHNPGGQPSGGWNSPPGGGYQQQSPYGAPTYGTPGYDPNAYGTGGYGSGGQPPQGPKNNTGWIVGIAVGTVVVIALAIVLGVMLTKNSKSDDKSTGTSSSVSAGQTTDESSTSTSNASDSSDIENVIRVYLSALVNEDWSKARSVSCSSNDEPDTMSSSAMNTSGYYVKKIVVDDISNVDVQPDRSSATADVAVTLTDDNSSSNSGSWMARMQRTGGQWKLCSIN